MENQILMLPANRQQDPLVDFIDAEDAVIIDEAPVQTKAYVNFLEANTNAITMEELSNTCVVPTWGNQELTISHQDFIRTVHDAATSFFSGETVNAPDIRVSHIVRGRIPSALHKKASELLESEKTQFYQRLAFAFTIPTIYETVNGERLELCVGGVRNYNDLNLYRQGKGVEKFSVFIGWRVSICSNQVLTGQGVSLQMEVMDIQQLWMKVMELFQQFNPASDIYLMKNLANSYLTETQFAQIVGRLQKSTQTKITGRVQDVVELTGKAYDISQPEQDSILDYLVKGGDLSLYGLTNAITRASQDVESYDRATALEGIGWQVATMPETLWREINS